MPSVVDDLAASEDAIVSRSARFLFDRTLAKLPLLS
jgi:hypothetical protein